tara:strand:- start:12198 stop:12515 length:318 start_codon:yes stop_codon:yes gene_type:complete
MNRVEQILEENIYPVRYQMSTAINVNNGVMNEQVLDKAKRAFLMETVGVWKDDLVKTSQGYPENDISDVVFDIDVVVLKRKDFEMIKNVYEQLFSQGEENIVDKA